MRNGLTTKYENAKIFLRERFTKILPMCMGSKYGEFNLTHNRTVYIRVTKLIIETEDTFTSQ